MKGPCVLLAGLVLVAAGCTNVKQVTDETKVREIVDGLNQEFVECWNGGEYECVAGMFSEDGWQMMPNAQAQAGPDAIRRFWQQAFGWGQWEVTLETSAARAERARGHRARQVHDPVRRRRGRAAGAAVLSGPRQLHHPLAA